MIEEQGSSGDGKSMGASAEPTGLSQAEPVSRLGPPGFDPSRWMRRAGLHRDWLMESVTLESAAIMGRHYGAREEWGKPVGCFCWTKETWRDEWDCDSETKAIGILFANGRVMDMRFGKSGTRTSFYSAPAIATEARRAETENTGSVHEGAGPKDIAHD